MSNLLLAIHYQLAFSDEAAQNSASLIANVLPIAHCQSLIVATKGRA